MTSSIEARGHEKNTTEARVNAEKRLGDVVVLLETSYWLDLGDLVFFWGVS